MLLIFMNYTLSKIDFHFKLLIICSVTCKWTKSIKKKFDRNETCVSQDVFIRFSKIHLTLSGPGVCVCVEGGGGGGGGLRGPDAKFTAALQKSLIL